MNETSSEDCVLRPIDAVVTWVDGNDPEHQRKRMVFSSESSRVGTLANANLSTRFAHEGELYFSIHLLRKNCPWLRKIFVVTDEQRPEWLTHDTATQLGVHLVDHRDIFEGYEQYLPTFSSRAIEAVLWRIKGLADQYLYLNDDFFVVRKTSPTDFFEGSKPVIRGSWVWINRTAAYVERNISHILRPKKSWAGLVGLRPEAKMLGAFRYFRLAHAPYSILKKQMENSFDDTKLLHETLMYRFRNINQVWPIGYHANQALRVSNAVIGAQDWSYISPSSFGGKVIEKQCILQSLGSSKFLCVQSLDQFDDNVKSTVLNFLNKSLV